MFRLLKSIVLSSIVLNNVVFPGCVSSMGFLVVVQEELALLPIIFIVEI